MTAAAATLREQCKAHEQAFNAPLSTDVLKKLAAFQETLLNSKLAEGAVQVGDTVPPVELPDADGNLVNVYDLLKNGPVVLSFQRGIWCGWCDLELAALQVKHEEIKAKGATLVSLSPQLRESTAKTVQTKKLDFPLLSDAGNVVGEKFGLVFSITPGLRALYVSWGCDIPAHNGNETWEVPIPATYVIGQDGIIVFSFVDTDPAIRAEPSDIVAAIPSKPEQKAAEVGMKQETKKTSFFRSLFCCTKVQAN